MIASLKEDFNYNNKTDYRVEILHTRPRYDAKAPDNAFIKHMKYLNFIKECEYNDFGKQQFIVRQRIIFVPFPEKYNSNYELIDILMDRIHKAAKTIVKKRSGPFIKILIHEHGFCINKKCLWKQFVDIANCQNVKKRPFSLHIIRTDTVFLNGCQDVADDFEFYKSPNPNFEIE